MMIDQRLPKTLLLCSLLCAACSSESTIEPTRSRSSHTNPSCASPCESSCFGVVDVTNLSSIDSEYVDAVGDGVTDDYPALKQAAEYVSTHGGSTLVFPAGTYLVDRVQSHDAEQSTTPGERS